MASTVRAVVSDAILNKLNDPRISPMTSVTRVEMSGDLQIAKVFVSVLGSETDGRRTMHGLKHAVGHIQRILAKRLHTRHCPEIRLEYDDSLKLAAETIQLIEESVREMGETPSDSGCTSDPENGPDAPVDTRKDGSVE